MKCGICETNINIIDWLASPTGKNMCIECRKIYCEEEKKAKEQMYKYIAERLEKRKNENRK